MAIEYSSLPSVLDHELAQRSESGYDVSVVTEQLSGPAREVAPDRARLLLDQLALTRRRPDWPYAEPSGLPEILSELPPVAGDPIRPIGAANLRDRIQAAWLGRCAGNCLGKPVEDGEFWTAERLRSYLELTGNYPVRDYVSRLQPMPDGYALHPSWAESTKGRIRYAPRDDDLDYTLLGLHLLESRGFDFTTADVGEEWLQRLPYHLTYTAERVTYRNLVCGIEPGRSAEVDNPFREWIGAQIRGDVFGYVCAGRPRDAAVLAFSDAALSHVANGIYGEMWAAALVAAAFTAGSLREAVEESIRHVPQRSRLAEALRWAVEARDKHPDWHDAVADLRLDTGTTTGSTPSTTPRSARSPCSMPATTTAQRSGWPSRPAWTPTPTARRSGRQPGRSPGGAGSRGTGPRRSVTCCAARCTASTGAASATSPSARSCWHARTPSRRPALV